MSDIWDNKKAQQQKRAADIMRGGSAGKGDKRRPTNESAYSAGLNLIKVAERYGNESDEYTEALAAWRAAVKEGR